MRYTKLSPERFKSFWEDEYRRKFVLSRGVIDGCDHSLQQWPMRAIIAAALLFILPGPARAEDGKEQCTLGGERMVTVTGTIRFLFTRVVPILDEQGHPDYSIVDNVDYYELSGVKGPCGPGPLRVRIEFGDVKTISCANGVAAEVSGFYRRDLADDKPIISIVVSSQLKCKLGAVP